MNKYEKKYKWMIKSSENESLDRKEKIGRSTFKTVAHAISGATGGFAGAAINNGLSYGIGLASMVTGELTGIYPLTSFGVGMITGVAVKQTNSKTPEVEKTGIEGAKQRMKEYANGLKQKFSFGSLFKKKSTTTTPPSEQTTNGFGEVKMFTASGGENFDLQELERYEKELEKSAAEFSATTTTPQFSDTTSGDVDGIEGSMTDVNERII